MIVTYQQFELINFPVFGLKSHDLEVTDGLLRLEGLVVDDRNQIGDTVGKRRLQTPHQLYPLKFHYEDLMSLVRADHRVFVDNKGYCFIYEKTKSCRVKPHKIVKVISKDTFTLLKLARVNSPVVVKRPPPLGKNWVGMLHLNDRPWIPYEYTEEKCAIKRRMI